MSDSSLHHFSAKRRSFMKISAVTSLQLLFSFQASANAAAQGVTSTEPCPSDPTISGYTSLAQLNADFENHARQLSSSATEPSQTTLSSFDFRYRLCPSTTFEEDTSDSQVHSLPLLTLPSELLQRNLILECGVNGESSDACTFLGGDTQVLIKNGSETPSSSNLSGSVSFRGITFQKSQGTSIAALVSSADVEANFLDCHWKDPEGSNAIFLGTPQSIVESETDLDVSFGNDNIFRPHRFQRRTSVTSASSKEEVLPSTLGHLLGTRSLGERDADSGPGMKITLTQCSFEHSPSAKERIHVQGFTMLDVRAGSLQLLESAIVTGGGALVVDVRDGSKLVAASSNITVTIPSGVAFARAGVGEHVGVAIVRSRASEVWITDSTVVSDHHYVVSLAALAGSQLRIDNTQFVNANWELTSESDILQPLSQIVVFESSQASIMNSCFEGTLTATGSTIVVDQSSQLEQGYNAMSRHSFSASFEDTSEMSTAALASSYISANFPYQCDMESNTNDIWTLDSEWNCLQSDGQSLADSVTLAQNGNLRSPSSGFSMPEDFTVRSTSSCTGSCQSMTHLSQCSSTLNPRRDDDKHEYDGYSAIASSVAKTRHSKGLTLCLLLSASFLFHAGL